MNYSNTNEYYIVSFVGFNLAHRTGFDIKRYFILSYIENPSQLKDCLFFIYFKENINIKLPLKVSETVASMFLSNNQELIELAKEIIKNESKILLS